MPSATAASEYLYGSNLKLKLKPCTCLLLKAGVVGEPNQMTGCGNLSLPAVLSLLEYSTNIESNS